MPVASYDLAVGLRKNHRLVVAVGDGCFLTMFTGRGSATRVTRRQVILSAFLIEIDQVEIGDERRIDLKKCPRFALPAVGSSQPPTVLNVKNSMA